MAEDMSDVAYGDMSIESETSSPPPLPYNLRDKKRSIAIIWAVIIFDSCILVTILFYALWFGTSLDHYISMGTTILLT